MWPKLASTLIVGALASTNASANNMYCCQDPASNRRVCADVVPEQCKGRGYKVINRQGTVIQEVGPPLTAEQKAERDAEAKRKQELEAEQREQRRRDAALLDTYSSVEDIDRLQARTEEEIKKGMALAEERIAEAEKRRQKFADEAEFYKKKELPTEVRRGLQAASDEIRAQKNLLASKQQDLDATRAKYTEDRRRYQELTGSGTRALHPAAAATPPRPAAANPAK
ncbi:MAG TPA: hypothetical protein PLW86_02665 [Rhodocyclaceae bacterium]|nr:hypothetical protein [Rhodocyclaceae bacterium]